MSRAQTNNSRAASQRSQANRSETRASRASGLSRTPSAERELLERLSGASVAEEEPDGGSVTGASQSRTSQQSRTASQANPTVASVTPRSRVPSQQSQTSVRRTPNESRGQRTRQSGTPVTSTSGEEQTETEPTDPTEFTETYETTESRTKTTTPKANTHSRGPIDKRNPIESTRAGVIRIPESTETSVDENDWRAGKTVQETNSYMLKYEISCDTVCVLDETRDEIKCHRYMLMSRSPVLFPLLQTPKANTRIELPDIKKDIFMEVIQYIYSDMFDVHADNVSGLLYAAKRLQLRGLTDVCLRFLDGDINTDTVTMVLELAHEYNETILFEKCLRYIYNRGAYVLKHKSMELLCASCLEKIIKSNDLRADEEAVYEGAIIWANAECRRKKLPPSDEYRRKVLGEMLFHVRFPILNKVYFTQKVSSTDLLTQEEKLSIYQYFHGSDLQVLSKFNANNRKETETAPLRPAISEPPPNERLDYVTAKVLKEDLQFVRRFHTSDGFWKQNGPADAITFLTSVPITLRGIEIFGTSAASEGYRVSLVVIDELRRSEVRKAEEFVFTEAKIRTYDVQISPVRIPARQPYTLVLTMCGSPTHKGVGGEARREVDGVKFEFKSSNKSPNGTDVSIGQIPGILFTRSE